MAILNKVGEIFGSLIFSLSLGFLIVFIALANFTQYNTLQPLVANMVETQLTGSIQQNQLDFIYLNLTEQCKSSTTAIVPIGDNNQINLKCDEVKNSTSSALPHLVANGVFDQIYYKKYECSFIECLRNMSLTVGSNVEQNQNFQIFLSAKANAFFTQNQIFLIGGIVAGIVLIIVSVRVWYNILKNIGMTLLLVGIVYLFIPLIKSKVPNIAEIQNTSQFIDILFAPIASFLRISLILGVILTASGYIVAYLMKKPKEK